MDWTDRFIRGYCECAVWASHDDNGEDCPPPLDKTHSVFDISAESLTDMAADCAAFIEANEADLYVYLHTFEADYAGHDFWLTRNHHGAGYWDRCPPTGDLHDACQRLTDAAHVYGESDLYVGDDGLIYAT